jgi:hypothetical protein
VQPNHLVSPRTVRPVHGPSEPSGPSRARSRSTAQPVELLSLSLSGALAAAQCSLLHRRTWPAGGLAAGSVYAEVTPVHPARVRSMEDGAQTLWVDRFRSSRPWLRQGKTTRSDQSF